MSKKLFITGATGYIGAAVAEAFHKAGYEVHALARTTDAADELRKRGYQPVQGDVKKAATYKDVVSEADVVVHSAATNDSEFADIENRVTQTIIEALQGTNKTFIYTSGVWVLGNTGSQIATDTTPVNPLPLVSWRPAVETRVIDAAQQGVRSIVIRPGIVYGRDGGIIRGFLEATKREGEFYFPGDGTNHWSPVYVEDLAKLYVLAAEKAKPGTLFNATQGTPVTVRTIAEHIAKAAGVPGRVQALTIEDARKRYGHYADGLILDQRIESPKAVSELGWQPVGPTLLDDIVNTQKAVALASK